MFCGLNHTHLLNTEMQQLKVIQQQKQLFSLLENPFVLTLKTAKLEGEKGTLLCYLFYMNSFNVKNGSVTMITVQFGY